MGFVSRKGAGFKTEKEKHKIHHKGERVFFPGRKEKICLGIGKSGGGN